MWEDAACRLASINIRGESDCRRWFRPAFQTPWTFDDIICDKHESSCDMFGSMSKCQRTLVELHGSSCHKFGSMSEWWREVWAHLGLLPNESGNPKLTLRDALILMDTRSEDCRRYLRLLQCSQAIEYPPQWIWFMSSSLSSSESYYTTQHLIQKSDFCIATLRNPRTGWEIQKWRQVHLINNPAKRLTDINQTSCQYHPLKLLSCKGRHRQEHTFDQ